MVDETKIAVERLVEARTALNIHKEEMVELVGRWKEFTEMEIDDDIVGVAMIGAVMQLLKQSMDKAEKYFAANNKYIEELEKRLEQVDFIN